MKGEGRSSPRQASGFPRLNKIYDSREELRTIAGNLAGLTDAVRTASESMPAGTEAEKLAEICQYIWEERIGSTTKLLHIYSDPESPAYDPDKVLLVARYAAVIADYIWGAEGHKRTVRPGDKDRMQARLTDLSDYLSPRAAHSLEHGAVSNELRRVTGPLPIQTYGQLLRFLDVFGIRGLLSYRNFGEESQSLVIAYTKEQGDYREEWEDIQVANWPRRIKGTEFEKNHDSSS